MFEILPNPSIETIMMVGRAALLLGAFWVFALAFSRWRRADERQMQHLCSELQRTFAEFMLSLYLVEHDLNFRQKRKDVAREKTLEVDAPPLPQTQTQQQGSR